MGETDRGLGDRQGQHQRGRGSRVVHRQTTDPVDPSRQEPRCALAAGTGVETVSASPRPTTGVVVSKAEMSGVHRRKPLSLSPVSPVRIRAHPYGGNCRAGVKSGTGDKAARALTHSTGDSGRAGRCRRWINDTCIAERSGSKTGNFAGNRRAETHPGFRFPRHDSCGQRVRTVRSSALLLVTDKRMYGFSGFRSEPSRFNTTLAA